MSSAKCLISIETSLFKKKARKELLSDSYSGSPGIRPQSIMILSGKPGVLLLPGPTNNQNDNKDNGVDDEEEKRKVEQQGAQCFRRPLTTDVTDLS